MSSSSTSTTTNEAVRARVQALIANGKRTEAAALLNDLGAAEANAKQARAWLKQALELQPNHFETLANLALIDHEDVTVELGSKLEAIGRALKANPKWSQGKKLQASILDDLGREQESIEAYRQALEVSPSDADCVYDLALIISRAGSLEEALTLAKRVIRLNSSHCPGHVLVAELLWRSGGQPKEVVHFAKKALELKPSGQLTKEQLEKLKQAKYSACLIIATVLEQSETPKDAAQFLSLATNLAITGGSGIDARPSLIRLATLFGRLGEDEQARECYKKLLDLVEKGDNSGRLLVSSFLGIGEGSAPESQARLSGMCEAFISHSCLDSPNDLVHKARLFLNLQVKGITNVCPVSALVKNVEHIEETIAKWRALEVISPIFFLKDPSVQRGQGIHVITHERIDSIPKSFFDSGRAMLLQVGVHPPLLLNERKFGLRVHALIVTYPLQSRLSLFVFEDCILTKCWLEYSAESSDPLVHISSTSVQRNVTGFDRDVSKGLASKMFPQLRSILERIREKVLLACRACHEEENQSGSKARRLHNTRDGNRPIASMQLFGFDFMLRDDLEPFIAEANASPQFVSRLLK